jgi:hypothetical protein
VGILDRLFRKPRQEASAPAPPQEAIELSDGVKANLSPDGYPIVDFSPSIRSVIRFDGIGFNYAQIYASQQNVRTVIDYVARQGAGLRLKFYRR